MVTSALKTLIDADAVYAQECKKVKQLAPCLSIKFDKYLSAQQEKTDKEEMKARGISLKAPKVLRDDEDTDVSQEMSNEE